jgi:hypothetical protein
VETEEDRREGAFTGELLDRLDLEMAIDAAGTKTFERLYQLIQRGYQPDLDEEFSGAIWLRHPAKNYQHSLLYLYPNGLVVSSGATDEFPFERDEHERFRRFLRSVPKPTFWDKNREARAHLGAWILIGLVMLGGAAAAEVARAVIKAVFAL